MVTLALASMTRLCLGASASGGACSGGDGGSSATPASLVQPLAALQAALDLPALVHIAAPGLALGNAVAALGTLRLEVLPPARQLAAAYLEWWRCPEQAAEQVLALGRAAAARSCAYLRCANLAAEGGPAAGQGAGSSKCSGCRAVW